MTVNSSFLQTEWYWLLGAAFAVSMFLGLRDRCPISPDRETQHYLQWGLLILYMEHCKGRVPQPYGTALVFVLFPYSALWDWTKALYHATTNTLPDAIGAPKSAARAPR